MEIKINIKIIFVLKSCLKIFKVIKAKRQNMNTVSVSILNKI